MLKDLILEETKTTPKVVFKTSGELLIEGRSYPDNTALYYEPLIDWIKDFSAEEITLNVKLNYFNTSSTKQLYVIFKLLAEKENCKNVYVNWHYEEDDDDTLESGRYFSRLLKSLNFSYTEYSIAR